MLLTDKQVKDFQRIYKEKFNEDISEAEAREQGRKLIGLMKIAYGLDSND